MPAARKKPREKRPFQVRLSDEQRARVARAAEVMAAERGVELVQHSTLFREVGMRGIDEILARHQPMARSA